MLLTSTSPLFAVCIYLVAFLTAYLINLKYRSHSTAGRNETIDGLRGFLGLAVFIHHASFWYNYAQVGKWRAPQSNMYIHMGQTSVSFFFMITSFLFISKLLNAKEGSFNWRSFYISRIYRLVPMYFVSILLLFICVMTLSHWTLEVSSIEFAKSVLKWSTFTYFGGSAINNVAETAIVNAGVIWSLPYEWLFYFSLPLMGLFLLSKRPSPVFIVSSLVFVLAYLVAHKGVVMQHILSFVGGAIAPFIIKYSPKKVNVNTWVANGLIVLCLYLIGYFDSANHLLCKILIAFIFTLVALGNSFFGVLTNSTVKFLGDICYTTYLMHGMVLFTVLYWGIGIGQVKQFSPTEYCGVILLMTPLVVLVSFLGYRFVEKPYMNKAAMLARKNNSR